MKTLKNNKGKLIICVFEIIVGVLLLINPIGFTKGIIIATGILMCIAGLKFVIKYFSMNRYEAVKTQFLVKGTASLLFGLFSIFKTDWFIVTFPLLTVIYGMVILWTALIKFQDTVNLIRLKASHWYISAIATTASAVFAIIILFNPFSSSTALWIFTGVALIVEATVDFITLIVNGDELSGQQQK